MISKFLQILGIQPRISKSFLSVAWTIFSHNSTEHFLKQNKIFFKFNYFSLIRLQPNNTTYSYLGAAQDGPLMKRQIEPYDWKKSAPAHFHYYSNPKGQSNIRIRIVVKMSQSWFFLIVRLNLSLQLWTILSNSQIGISKIPSNYAVW